MLATGLNPIAVHSPEGEEAKLDPSEEVVKPTTTGEAAASQLPGGPAGNFRWPVCCWSVPAMVELYEERDPSWSLVLA